MALSPWPPEPSPLPESPAPTTEEQAAYDAALESHNMAVALVRGATTIDTDKIKRLGPVADAFIADFVDGQTVPATVLDEAIIRFVSALAESLDMGGSIWRGVRVSSAVSVDRITNHSALFRRAGCEMLLSPFLTKSIQVI